MSKHDASTVRNVGVFGHQGSGKTSLVEAMLMASGALDRMGRVDDGTATTDFDPEEVRRKISINIGMAPCYWGGAKINVLDAPGYLDFEGEVRIALRVVETAVLVTPAQGSLEVGFEIAWDHAALARIPRVVFVSRMDRENADFYGVVEKLREVHGSAIAPIQLPIGEAEGFRGVVDLITMKAVQGIGSEFTEIPIPEDMAEAVERYRTMLVEAAAEGDDSLMEKYFETENLSEEEIRQGLTAGLAAGKVVPVLCGAATRNQGAASLMNLIVSVCPAPDINKSVVGATPAGAETTRETSSGEPMCALVFKTLADPFVGQLTYFRVYSGTIHSDSHVLNSNNGKDERIGQLYVVRGKVQEPVAELKAGDMGAVAKLTSTHTGDTLCDTARPIILAKIEFNKPIYEIAIVPKTKVDEDKLGPGLQRVSSEDPSFRFRRDSETGQTVLSGMGETHLSIVIEKLKKFGANVEQIPLKVPYRETILTKAEGQGRHKKQTGGRGQYGDCHIRLEPLPRGSGFEFVDAIVGGSIPRQYLPAVEKGVIEAMATGILAGNTVVDLRCTCYDGSYHDVDSSEQAFKMAGILAFNNVAPKANPVILEPIVSVSITVPDGMMGDVMADLSGKRGRIIGTEPLPGGRVRVNATVPLAEMLRYAIDLRSISRGRGVFALEPSHYEEVPAHVAQTIIAEYQKSREHS